MNVMSSTRSLMIQAYLASFFLISQFISCNAMNIPMQFGEGAQQVSAIHAFGDSTIDAGNNNFLSSIAKSNYWPYGIDFSQGATGRFCNGKTVMDLLGEKLSLPLLPAFADPTSTGSRIIPGMNYASAGAGIIDETGRHWGDRYSLTQQVLNFERTLDQLRNLMDGQKLIQYLERSIAFMSFGSNDYINNYLLPSIYRTSLDYKPPEFANLLLNHYTRQLMALYNLGLRKFFIVGLAPIGCIPNQRGVGQERCLDSVNEMLGTFNEGLKSLVQQLNAKHPSAIFVYFNAYGVMGDMLNNPSTYGFEVIDQPCCGIGQVTCLPTQTPCANRNQFLFWDAYHTTEAANSLIAQRAFDGPQSDCFPINLRQLALI